MADYSISIIENNYDLKIGEISYTAKYFDSKTTRRSRTRSKMRHREMTTIVKIPYRLL